MASTSIDQLADALPAALAPKATSLIVTVFGDSLAPYGRRIWLGSLIALMAPLGLGERLVRTATNRLAQAGWLERRTRGRRSYFGLTESGGQRFERATRRIFADRPPPWNGNWHLLFSGGAGLDAAGRESLRRDLALLGFGLLAPGVHAHPSPDRKALAQALDEAGILGQAPLFEARGSGFGNTPGALRALVARGWDLERLAAAYRQFLDQFQPLWRLIEKGRMPSPGNAFVIRSLLIHEYRRVMLHDPMLPDQLLPTAWPGTAAHDLCRDIYRQIWPPVERHVTSIIETMDGPLPATSPAFRQRFGGLPEPAPGGEDG